ncbi:MAG: sensor histidine kinase, partial [Salibacteraceae bacterium]
TTLYPRSLAVDTITTVLAFSMLEPVVRAKVWLADQPFEKLWAQRDGAKMLGANMGRCRSVSKEGIQFIDSTNGSPLVVSDIFTDASNAGYVLSSGGTVYQIDSVSLELDAIAQFDCSYVPEQLVVKGDLLVVYNNGELLYMDRTEGVQRRFNGLLPFSTDELIDLELTENYLWVAQTSQIFRVPYAALFQETLPLVQPLQLEGFPVAEASNQLPADPGPIRVFMHYTDVLAKHQLQYSYQLNEEEWINMERLTNVLTLSNLAAGNYDLGVRVKRGTQVVNERSLSFSIAPHWYETRWFIALLVLLVFGATVFFFRSRIQVIKKRNRVQQQLNEAQHTALKAQMNPHFLFNVLNSMQTMVLKEDKIKANKIMSELSVFVRKVLNYSGKALIPLQDELEMLHNYLKLEKHRFNEDFSYEVKVDPALEDAMHLLMPPMLLQPFVENAINHGLLHKKNDRQLNITFTQSGQELICAIEDNGVGRKRAAELQQKSKKHSSFASGASSRRINLLKDAGYQQADIHIEDRYHPNNQPAGTRVNLRLPLTHPT